MLRINAKYFTAYHSETDEQMKHLNAVKIMHRADHMSMSKLGF